MNDQRMPADGKDTARLIERLQEMAPEFHWSADYTNAFDELEIRAKTVRVYDNGWRVESGLYVSHELVAACDLSVIKTLVDATREGLHNFLAEQGVMQA